MVSEGKKDKTLYICSLWRPRRLLAAAESLFRVAGVLGATTRKVRSLQQGTAVVAAQLLIGIEVVPVD